MENRQKIWILAKHQLIRGRHCSCLWTFITIISQAMQHLFIALFHCDLPATSKFDFFLHSQKSSLMILSDEWKKCWNFQIMHPDHSNPWQLIHTTGFKEFFLINSFSYFLHQFIINTSTNQMFLQSTSTCATELFMNYFYIFVISCLLNLWMLEK